MVQGLEDPASHVREKVIKALGGVLDCDVSLLGTAHVEAAVQVLRLLTPPLTQRCWQRDGERESGLTCFSFAPQSDFCHHTLALRVLILSTESRHHLTPSGPGRAYRLRRFLIPLHPTDRAWGRGEQRRLADGAISVRRAAVELLGKYIAAAPAYAARYYPAVVERLTDVGVSVRKVSTQCQTATGKLSNP